jgi:ankyrin repeat protein
VSQRFLNLIRSGQTAEVAAAAEEDRSLITCRDAQGVSAFLWSIYNRQPLIKDYLLTHLPALDIFEASALGDCTRLEPLLRQDPLSVHATSADGWAPLHLAAAFGGAQATALLLAHGAHVHRFSHNPMRNQPLHACIALSRDLETVRILIAQGADVNMAQAGGYTPLHQAAAAGLVELTRSLLEAGAKPDLRCDQGKTPADYARERSHEGVLQVLENCRSLRSGRDDKV